MSVRFDSKEDHLHAEGFSTCFQGAQSRSEEQTTCPSPLFQNCAESYVLTVGRVLGDRDTIKTFWACCRVAFGAAPTAVPSSGRSREATCMHSD